MPDYDLDGYDPVKAARVLFLVAAQDQDQLAVVDSFACFDPFVVVDDD